MIEETGQPGASLSAKVAKLAMVVSAPITVRYLLRGQLAFLKHSGFDITVLTASEEGLSAAIAAEGAVFQEIPIARATRPLQDLKALAALYRRFRRLKPDLAVVSTPKAGLLGSLAAQAARVPVRVYLVRGLRAEIGSGLSRQLLRGAERVASGAATDLLCVSPSLAELFETEGLSRGKKLTVLGSGSSNGVNIERFRAGSGAGLRRRLAIPEDAPVVGFVGRLARDKGLPDLVNAFRNDVRTSFPGSRLVLVGGIDANSGLGPEEITDIQGDSCIEVTGFVEDTAPFYRIFNVLALPSYREGMPNVALEAAASETPVIAYDATGSRDAVADGQTGTLVKKGDVSGLGRAISNYFEQPDLGLEHGRNGRRWVASEFEQSQVWNNFALYLRGLLDSS